VLAEVASNWQIVAIAFGVPAFLLSVLLVVGSSRRFAALWAAAALVFGVVAGFGLYDSFVRPIPRAAAAGRGPAQPTLPPVVAPAGGGSSCAPSGMTLSITARNLQFSTKCLAAPANTPVNLAFDNADAGVQHNVHIFSADPAKDPGAKSLFMGTLVGGPKTETYHVPALPPGTYFFHCDVHATMFGTYQVP
jgi:plastocyanin